MWCDREANFFQDRANYGKFFRKFQKNNGSIGRFIVKIASTRANLTKNYITRESEDQFKFFFEKNIDLSKNHRKQIFY